MVRFARRGYEQFYIVDNTFNRPEAHALEVCRLLEPLGGRWRCIIYPHKVSAELVRAMGRAGCVEVALGFESGSQPVLDAMNKHYTQADVRRVSAMLADRSVHRSCSVRSPDGPAPPAGRRPPGRALCPRGLRAGSVCGSRRGARCWRWPP